MGALIFAFMQAYGGDERESLLLARSLRAFGGELADRPLWLMMPEEVEQLSASAHRVLADLGVDVCRFVLPEDSLAFPFGGKVHAAAAAEERASGAADVLVWMDSDTVFAGTPGDVRIESGVALGYRPVMLKNISSPCDEPPDAFWRFVYEGCGTPAGRAFPMTTTVDGARIRAQFNAGILCVRPGIGLLRAWRDRFEQLFREPPLAPFYEAHELYRIFVHQAILSATLLARLGEAERRDLGPRVNFPMFLGAPPEGARHAVTLRYDAFEEFEDAGWRAKVVLARPFEEWLRAQLEAPARSGQG